MILTVLQARKIYFLLVRISANFLEIKNHIFLDFKEDLLEIPGEARGVSAYGDDDDKPIRTLDDFTLFDACTGQMVELDIWQGRSSLHVVVCGFVGPLFYDESTAANFNQYEERFMLSSVQRLTFDYTEPNE